MELILKLGKKIYIFFRSAILQSVAPFSITLSCILGGVGGGRDSGAAEVPGLSEDPDDRAAYAGHRLRVGWREAPLSALQLAGEGDSSHAYDLQL